MYRTLIVALLASLALPACTQVPRTPDASAAPVRSSASLMQTAAAGGSAPASEPRYRTAVVQDLAIEGVDPQLAALFGASFRETLQREGYVRLALPGESGASASTFWPDWVCGDGLGNTSAP